VIVVDGELRPYAWGRIDGLTRWATATAGPQAELWFGRAGDAGSAEHPLLTKLLAAANPLSIQVHPTDEVVARLDASDTTRPLLSDHVEKNELLLALEPFTAFAGFRDDAVSERLLLGLGLRTAAQRAADGDHVALVRELFALSEVVLVEAFRRLSDVIHAVLPAHERAAVELVRAWYPHDRGVLVALCLAVHELSEGDALYVPAGVVHSYVNGLGVEVMTASDNVLRLGLTQKHVAVDAALGAMTADAPTILRGQAEDGVSVYHADGAPFVVRRTEGDGVELQVPTGTAATALCVTGSAVVECAGRTESLRPGQAALIGRHDGGAVVRADGSTVLASAA
jgi:mannose-6-phosphate isomerase